MWRADENVCVHSEGFRHEICCLSAALLRLRDTNCGGDDDMSYVIVKQRATAVLAGPCQQQMPLGCCCCCGCSYLGETTLLVDATYIAPNIGVQQACARKRPKRLLQSVQIRSSTTVLYRTNITCKTELMKSFSETQGQTTRWL